MLQMISTNHEYALKKLTNMMACLSLKCVLETRVPRDIYRWRDIYHFDAIFFSENSICHVDRADTTDTKKTKRERSGNRTVLNILLSMICPMRLVSDDGT